MPRSNASRSTAMAASRSAGGPNTCVPASCIAPYPMRVTVRSSAMVNVPPGSVFAAMRDPRFVVVSPRASRSLSPTGHSRWLVQYASGERAREAAGVSRDTLSLDASSLALHTGDMDRDELADFLRRRRDALQPDDVGLHAGERRRTRGLRREEVAALAHMSTDFYARLEQRRGSHPSEQTTAALARALRLTQDERDHLFALA